MLIIEKSQNTEKYERKIQLPKRVNNVALYEESIIYLSIYLNA